MQKTPIADLTNAEPSREAGSSTAAAFLNEFAENKPFLHLDIAGTADTNARGNGIMLKTLFEIIGGLTVVTGGMLTTVISCGTMSFSVDSIKEYYEKVKAMSIEELTEEVKSLSKDSESIGKDLGEDLKDKPEDLLKVLSLTKEITSLFTSEVNDAFFEELSKLAIELEDLAGGEYTEVMVKLAIIATV
ncbi:hypothetical protein FQR65_LT19006 [Abscondita terminalis]|nr:hypothetical protein FQR65_LT19006 [Abscondita terminalis]